MVVDFESLIIGTTASILEIILVIRKNIKWSCKRVEVAGIGIGSTRIEVAMGTLVRVGVGTT